MLTMSMMTICPSGRIFRLLIFAFIIIHINAINCFDLIIVIFFLMRLSCYEDRSFIGLIFSLYIRVEIEVLKRAPAKNKLAGPAPEQQSFAQQYLYNAAVATNGPIMAAAEENDNALQPLPHIRPNNAVLPTAPKVIFKSSSSLILMLALSVFLLLSVSYHSK